MKLVDTDGADGFFDVVAETERTQAATMVLAPDESTGGPENRHAGDQWLYVVSGRGTAVVEANSHDLEPGVLVLIEADETHEIRGGDDEPLRTVNVYAPPAY